jgi:hypothetical protein
MFLPCNRVVADLRPHHWLRGHGETLPRFRLPAEFINQNAAAGLLDFRRDLRGIFSQLR